MSDLAKPGRIQVKHGTGLTLKFYGVTKLLVAVFRSVSVEKLVSVEDAPSACSDRYRWKMIIHKYLWF